MGKNKLLLTVLPTMIIQKSDIISYRCGDAMYIFDTFLCSALFFPLNFLNHHIKSEQLIEWEPFRWLVKMFYCKNNKNSTLMYL